MPHRPYEAEIKCIALELHDMSFQHEHHNVPVGNVHIAAFGNSGRPILSNICDKEDIIIVTYVSTMLPLFPSIP